MSATKRASKNPLCLTADVSKTQSDAEAILQSYFDLNPKTLAEFGRGQARIPVGLSPQFQAAEAFMPLLLGECTNEDGSIKTIKTISALTATIMYAKYQLMKASPNMTEGQRAEVEAQIAMQTENLNALIANIQIEDVYEALGVKPRRVTVGGARAPYGHGPSTKTAKAKAAASRVFNSRVARGATLKMTKAAAKHIDFMRKEEYAELARRIANKLVKGTAKKDDEFTVPNSPTTRAVVEKEIRSSGLSREFATTLVEAAMGVLKGLGRVNLRMLTFFIFMALVNVASASDATATAVPRVPAPYATPTIAPYASATAEPYAVGMPVATAAPVAVVNGDRKSLFAPTVGPGGVVMYDPKAVALVGNTAMKIATGEVLYARKETMIQWAKGVVADNLGLTVYKDYNPIITPIVQEISKEVARNTTKLMNIAYERHPEIVQYVQYLSVKNVLSSVLNANVDATVESPIELLKKRKVELGRNITRLSTEIDSLNETVALYQGMVNRGNTKPVAPPVPTAAAHSTARPVATPSATPFAVAPSHALLEAKQKLGIATRTRDTLQAELNASTIPTKVTDKTQQKADITAIADFAPSHSDIHVSILFENRTHTVTEGMVSFFDKTTETQSVKGIVIQYTHNSTSKYIELSPQEIDSSLVPFALRFQFPALSFSVENIQKISGAYLPSASMIGFTKSDTFKDVNEKVKLVANALRSAAEFRGRLSISMFADKLGAAYNELAADASVDTNMSKIASAQAKQLTTAFKESSFYDVDVHSLAIDTLFNAETVLAVFNGEKENAEKAKARLDMVTSTFGTIVDGFLNVTKNGVQGSVMALVAGSDIAKHLGTTSEGVVNKLKKSIDETSLTMFALLIATDVFTNTGGVIYGGGAGLNFFARILSWLPGIGLGTRGVAAFVNTAVSSLPHLFMVNAGWYFDTISQSSQTSLAMGLTYLAISGRLAALGAAALAAWRAMRGTAAPVAGAAGVALPGGMPAAALPGGMPAAALPGGAPVVAQPPAGRRRAGSVGRQPTLRQMWGQPAGAAAQRKRKTQRRRK
jgi:hypothetical protein